METDQIEEQNSTEEEELNMSPPQIIREVIHRFSFFGNFYFYL